MSSSDLGRMAQQAWFAAKGNAEECWEATVDVILEEAAKTVEDKASEIPESARTPEIAFQEAANAIRWMKSR